MHGQCTIEWHMVTSSPDERRDAAHGGCGGVGVSFLCACCQHAVCVTQPVLLCSNLPSRLKVASDGGKGCRVMSSLKSDGTVQEWEDGHRRSSHILE